MFRLSTSLNFPYHVWQLLATGSTDKMVKSLLFSFFFWSSKAEVIDGSYNSIFCWIFLQVKLWDLSNNQPSCLVSKNPKAVCDHNFPQISRYKKSLNMFLDVSMSHDTVPNVFRELSFLFPSQRTTLFCSLLEAPRGPWKWVKKPYLIFIGARIYEEVRIIYPNLCHWNLAAMGYIVRGRGC